MDKYKNQYLISSTTASNLDPNIEEIQFDKFYVYKESSLNVNIVKREDKEICLIGFLINPLKPGDSNIEILKSLLLKCNDFHSFQNEIEILSGRFILLFKISEQIILFGDGFHSRQILFSNYNGKISITSSLQLYYHMYNESLHIDQDLSLLTQNPKFNQSEQDFYGNRTIDKRFLRLLPNHSLDLNSYKISRINIKDLNLNFEDTVNRSIQILQGTFEALAKNHKLLQPITAGWDSRMLLATSINYKEKIKYYIFSRPNNLNSADVILPKRIDESLNLGFEVLETRPINQTFLECLGRENINPRILPKTSDIQYHFYNHSKIENVINVNGAAGGVMRMVYGKNKRQVKLDDLPFLTPYGNKSDFINNNIKSWYNGVLEYSRENNFSILDLFYIENRMGNWGALYPKEQDIAIEEILVFNNKQLLANILRLDPSERSYPDYKICREIIKRTCPKALDFEINPGNSIKKMVKADFELCLLLKKLKHKFQFFLN